MGGFRSKYKFHAAIVIMDKCVFCDIAAKRVPAAVVYEDADVVAFLDINPLNRGHTIVAPKQHVRWAYDIDKFGDFAEVAKAVANAAVSALGAKSVNIMTVGEEVVHAHMHVVPRYEKDGHGALPMIGAVKQISKEEMASIAAKLADAIAKAPPKKCAAAPVPKAEEKPAEHSMEEELSEEQVELVRREFECG